MSALPEADTVFPLTQSFTCGFPPPTNTAVSPANNFCSESYHGLYVQQFESEWPPLGLPSIGRQDRERQTGRSWEAVQKVGDASPRSIQSDNLRRVLVTRSNFNCHKIRNRSQAGRCGLRDRRGAATRRDVNGGRGARLANLEAHAPTWAELSIGPARAVSRPRRIQQIGRVSFATFQLTKKWDEDTTHSLVLKQTPVVYDSSLLQANVQLEVVYRPVFSTVVRNVGNTLSVNQWKEVLEHVYRFISHQPWWKQIAAALGE